MIAVFPSYLISGEACLFGGAFLAASSFPCKQTRHESRCGLTIHSQTYLNIHIRHAVRATRRSVVRTRSFHEELTNRRS